MTSEAPETEAGNRGVDLDTDANDENINEVCWKRVLVFYCVLALKAMDILASIIADVIFDNTKFFIG